MVRKVQCALNYKSSAGSFTSTGAAIPTKVLFFEKKGKTKKIWFCEVEGKFTKSKRSKKKIFHL